MDTTNLPTEASLVPVLCPQVAEGEPLKGMPHIVIIRLMNHISMPPIGSVHYGLFWGIGPSIWLSYLDETHLVEIQPRKGQGPGLGKVS